MAPPNRRRTFKLRSEMQTALPPLDTVIIGPPLPTMATDNFVRPRCQSGQHISQQEESTLGEGQLKLTVSCGNTSPVTIDTEEKSTKNQYGRAGAETHSEKPQEPGLRAHELEGESTLNEGDGGEDTANPTQERSWKYNPRYTKAEIEWLTAHTAGLDALEVDWDMTAHLFNAKFSGSRTAVALYGKMYKRPKLGKKKAMFTAEEEKWVVEQVPRMKVMRTAYKFRWDHVADLFNEKFRREYTGEQVKGRWKKLRG